MTAHIRITARETPKGQIECPIGGTVKPKKICKRCAYASNCQSYEEYLEKKAKEWHHFSFCKFVVLNRIANKLNFHIISNKANETHKVWLTKLVMIKIFHEEMQKGKLTKDEFIAKVMKVVE
jgi:hypothetical protein